MENWSKKIHVGSSLPSKDGQFAMFVGRWQPLHLGHQELFKRAMDEGKNVLISFLTLDKIIMVERMKFYHHLRRM